MVLRVSKGDFQSDFQIPESIPKKKKEKSMAGAKTKSIYFGKLTGAHLILEMKPATMLHEAHLPPNPDDARQRDRCAVC
jgi:hypothetical protein